MDSDEVPTRHVGPAIKVRGRQEPAFKQGTPTPPPSKRGRKWKVCCDLHLSFSRKYSDAGLMPDV